MSLKKTLLAVAFASGAILLLDGCSSNYQLTPAAQNVHFIDTKPADNCQFLGSVEGRRNTFFSGNKTHSELMKDAAADLLNKAAALGGNTIYQAQDSSVKYVSEIAPLDAVMSGDVYKCPAK